MRKAGSSRIWGFSLACLYLLLVAGPLMLSFMLKADRATLGREMSLAFALLGVPILALQPVLAARIRVADRVFGLDSIYVFHQIMAMAAGFLLLAHPFLLASESSWSLLTSFAQPWPLLLGKVNLAILAVIIVISLFRNSLGTRYERWRKLHNVLAILLLTGAVIHSMTIGSDLKEGTVKAVWLLLAFLAAGCYVNHKIIGPWIRRKEGRDRIEIGEARKKGTK